MTKQTIPMVKIHNVETNEIIEREMNADELAIYEAEIAFANQQEIDRAAKIAASESAINKLSVLGLTPEEIAALRG